MKRLLVITLALGIFAALAVGLTQEELPEHPHVMVIGVEFDEVTGAPLSYRQCVELAAGQALRLNSHHAHSHTGTAGYKLSTNASTFVIPLAPLTPWASCQEIIDTFFP